MSDLKHVGKIRATNKKCLVAYRTLPNDPYNCLIIPTESLLDAQHDSIINLVESSAGQNAYEFAEALARTSFPDGSIMLAALHSQSRLVKIQTSEIDMIPRPGVSVSLAEINQHIASQQGVTIDQLALRSSDKKEELEQAESETLAEVQEIIEPSVSEPVVTDDLSNEQKVKIYRSQADKLSKEAAKFRRLADELQPIVRTRKQKAPV